MMKPDLSVDLCGVTLKNPIIPASGTFGYGRDFVKFYDISTLGAVSAKGVTPLPAVAIPPSESPRPPAEYSTRSAYRTLASTNLSKPNCPGW